MATLAEEGVVARQMCVNVLCAYLRMPYRRIEGWPDLPDKRDGAEKNYSYENDQRLIEKAISMAPGEVVPAESHVRETIVRVITEHLNPRSRIPWFGSTFDLTGAVFDDLNIAGGRFTDC